VLVTSLQEDQPEQVVSSPLNNLRISPDFNDGGLDNVMERKSKQEHSISQEDRKKMLLNDDDNDFEDEALYGKINQMKAELFSDHSDHDNPIDSAITFNDNEAENKSLGVRRESKEEDDDSNKNGSRPSDVVNFDDKSENEAANKSDVEVVLEPDNEAVNIINNEEPIKFSNEGVYQPDNDESPDIPLTDDYYHNGSFEKEHKNVGHKIDEVNQEIENKLDMIDKKVFELSSNKKEVKPQQFVEIDKKMFESEQIKSPVISDSPKNLNFMSNSKEIVKNTEPQPSENPYKRKNKKLQRNNEESQKKKEELKKLMKLFEKKQVKTQKVKQRSVAPPVKHPKLVPKASRKPRPRLPPQQAATVIQKWIKGHIQRKEFSRLKDNVKKIRKLRRFLSVGYKKLKTKYIKNLVHVLKQSSQVVERKHEQVLKKYRVY